VITVTWRTKTCAIVSCFARFLSFRIISFWFYSLSFLLIGRNTLPFYLFFFCVSLCVCVFMCVCECVSYFRDVCVHPGVKDEWEIHTKHFLYFAWICIKQACSRHNRFYCSKTNFDKNNWFFVLFCFVREKDSKRKYPFGRCGCVRSLFNSHKQQPHA
jgi:hypothetical protein